MKSQTQARPRIGPIIAAVAVVAAVLSQVVTIGADTYWLVALGDHIRVARAVPAGVPFLADATGSWVNVPVLGEVLFSLIAGLGSWGLITAQIAAAALILLVLCLDARARGAGNAMCVAAMIAFVGGNLVSLGIVRAQLWSLPLFVSLVFLLRSEHRRPSGRIWLMVPLVAVWGNLHGAVLVGVAVAGAYLLLGRFRSRRLETFLVGTAMVAALWATPAGLRSHEYYLRVLSGEAPGSGGGMWAQVQLTSPQDVLLIGAGVLLAAGALTRRLPLWEIVASTGLLVLAGIAARHGVWLLAFLAPRAALARIPWMRNAQPMSSTWKHRAITTALLLLSGCFAVTGLASQGSIVAAHRVEAQDLARLVGHRVTLAPSPLSESLATDGVLLWAGNPLDALPRDRQRAYLDFQSHGSQVLEQLAPKPDAVILARDAHQHAPAMYVLLGQTVRYSVYVPKSVP